MGCTPQIENPSTAQTIKRDILGSWYSKADIGTKDGIQIKGIGKETFYRNGTLKSMVWLNFFDLKGRHVGKVLFTRYFQWQAKGNTIVAKFKNCKTRVLKKSRHTDIAFFGDFMSLACKYANSGKIATPIIKYVRAVGKNKAIIGNEVYTRKR